MLRRANLDAGGIGCHTQSVTWVVFVVIPMSAQIPLKLFPNRLLLIVIAVSLMDATLATLLGAWLYKEA